MRHHAHGGAGHRRRLERRRGQPAWGRGLIAQQNSARPLEGISVLSLAEQYPGPYATLLLGDMGADVLLVERPAGGDPARQFPGFFEALNRGKRSLALDLKRAEGARALRRLAGQADVLLEGYRPGTMSRLGLDADQLLERNPRLVYVSISGFGQDGPYRDRPGHDVCYQAVAGMLHEQPAGEGDAPSIFTGDLSAGMFGALAALAALTARSRTGHGGYVDVSMADGLLSWMTTSIVPFLNRTAEPGLPRDPGYGTYRCADGDALALGIAHEDRFWKCLCRVLGIEDVADLTHEQRVARRPELVDRIAATLARRPADEWEPALVAADVPVGAVRSLDGVMGDPQFAARGMFTEVSGDQAHSGRTFVRQPLRFDGRGPGPRRHVPALGEHTRAALEKAGYTSAEIDQLIRLGVAAGPRMTSLSRRAAAGPA